MADTPQSAQPNPHKKINLVSLLELCKTQDDPQWADSTITAYITALSPDELHLEIAKYDKDGLTPMQSLAIRGYASSISAIAKKMGADVFSQHAMQDNLLLQPTTPLKYAVRQFNRTGCFTTILVFIEEMSANALNQAIQEYSRRDTDAPNQAIRLCLERKGEDSALVAIINKLSANSLHAVLMEGYFPVQPIQTIANFQSPSIVQAIVNRLSLDDLNSSLSILLRSLICRGETFREVVKSIIEKASNGALKYLLVDPKPYGDPSILYWLAKQGDEETFNFLIMQFSAAILRTAIFRLTFETDRPSFSTQSLFHWLGSYSKGNFLLLLCKRMQEEDAFLATSSLFDKTYDLIIKQEDHDRILGLEKFLAILPPVALDNLLIQKTYYNDTKLHILFKKGSNAIITTIVEHMSPDGLAAGLAEKDPRGALPLWWLILRGQKQALLTVLRQLSTQNFKKLLAIGEGNQSLIDWLTAEASLAMSYEALLPWLVLLLKASSLIENEEVDVERLREIEAQQHDQAFVQRCDSLPIELQHLIKITFEETNRYLHLLTHTETIVPTITLANRSQLKIDDDEAVLAGIRNSGPATWKDFWMLQSWSDEHPENILLKIDIMILKALKTLQLPNNIPSHVQAIYEAMARGCLAVKMFSGWKPHAWSEYVTGHVNTQIRAKLRVEYPDDRWPTRKYNLRTREIQPYPKKDEPRKEKPHHTTHQKASSGTLLSPKVLTPVFQGHQTDVLLVGVAIEVDSKMEQTSYDRGLAKLKALFPKDIGSFARRWCGTYEAAQAFQRQVRHYSSHEEFMRAIDTKLSRTNEILVETSRDCHLGIVMVGEDTPKMRQRAEQYQREIKKAWNKDLPIIFYDPNTRIFIADLDWFEKFQQEQQRGKVLALATFKRILGKYECHSRFFVASKEIRALRGLAAQIEKEGKTEVTRLEFEAALKGHYSQPYRGPSFLKMPGISKSAPLTDDGACQHSTDSVLIELRRAFGLTKAERDQQPLPPQQPAATFFATRPPAEEAAAAARRPSSYCRD